MNLCKLWMPILITCTAVACGDASNVGSTSDNAPEVRIQVTGDQTASMESNGSLYCGESSMGGEPFYFELYAMQPPYQFNLRFPRDIQPGTHPVFGSDDPQSNSDSDRNAYFYWTGENRQRFDQVLSGELILESVPSAQGERLIGSVNADLGNDDGSSVQFSADLDLDAGAQSFDECP